MVGDRRQGTEPRVGLDPTEGGKPAETGYSVMCRKEEGTSDASGVSEGDWGGRHLCLSHKPRTNVVRCIALLGTCWAGGTYSSPGEMGGGSARDWGQKGARHASCVWFPVDGVGEGYTVPAQATNGLTEAVSTVLPTTDSAMEGHSLPAPADLQPSGSQSC